jgi:hypothetical protein
MASIFIISLLSRVLLNVILCLLHYMYFENGLLEALHSGRDMKQSLELGILALYACRLLVRDCSLCRESARSNPHCSLLA